MGSASESGRHEYVDDALTRRIIRCFIDVHRTLGPGFLESIYRNALSVEFRRQGIPFVREHVVQITYEGEEVGAHRLDFLVAESVVVELKAVETLSYAHYAQVRSYLKATGRTRGLLVNFASVKADYRRVEI